MLKIKFTKKIIVFWAIVAFILALDQITKALLPQEGIHYIIKGFLEISYIENRGAALGIWQNGTLFFIIVTTLALIAIFFINHRVKNKTWLYYISLSFVVGGGIGNLIDRVILFYVRDFFHFNWLGFTCNIADIFVTFGCIMLAFYVFFQMDKGVKVKQTGSEGVKANESDKTDEDGVNGSSGI